MARGYARVRPLQGGFDAWIAAGYDMQPLSAVAA
jgi:rhodanese-related sulfurtransferase